MKVRLTEQVASVIEISYDVELPPGDEIEDAEDHLERATDEVHRETVRVHREIIGREEIA